MHFVTLLALVVALQSLGVSVSAEPGIVYRYAISPKLQIVGVDAVVDLEPAETGNNCSQGIAETTIDEVAYEGTTDIIIGFKAQKPGTASNAWYGLFRMATSVLYRKLPNAERHYVQILIRKGARVIVVYQVCGSGGFVSVRDVWARAAMNSQLGECHSRILISHAENMGTGIL